MAKHRRFPFIFKPVPKPARTTLLVSPIEKMFWDAYRRMRPRSLDGLVQQYKVGQYRIDFALPRHLIGIELDGYTSHSSVADITKDHQRQRDLEARGWYIIRFGGGEVYHDAARCVMQAAKLAELYSGRHK
jgi:very-short-patch-repair endonuclease